MDHVAGALARLLDGRRILLDFDGPVCSVFAGYPAPVVAEDLHRELTALGLAGAVPPGTRDPMQVLRLAAHTVPERAAEVDAALARLERRAVTTASPTSGAHDLITTCAAQGRHVVIVSNNNTEAISEYLNANNLSRNVHSILGRDPHNVRHMKPDPYLVRQAVSDLAARANGAVLIGDSQTDIVAAHANGTPAIGFANKPGKERLFATADAIVTSISQVTESLHRD